MAVSVAFPARAVPVSLPEIPWYLWASVIGVTSAMIGVEWDISWHRSIGRDTFWTPPHIAIHLCGIIAGITSAYLILATTFGKLPEVRRSSVKMWGFHGPLGAFITAWGGVAMLVSAPFDDWWHNAYGLDVKILSPPHTVLAAGIIGIEMGALVLVLGHMNRADGEERRHLNWMYLYLGSMIIVVLQILTMEHTFRVVQHTATFFIAMAIVFPPALIGVTVASEQPWAATIVAGIYTLFMASLVWILPLFPAEPKLGPVFNPVTQFIPPNFPLLLMIPAVALDLLRRRLATANVWLQTCIYAAAFFGTFTIAQWFFSDFLITPAAANRFFGTMYHDYGTPPESFEGRNVFVPAESNFPALMLIAFAVCLFTTRAGLGWGKWMRAIRR